MIKSIPHSLRPYTLLFLISTFFYQCIEPFDAVFENFESAIVIEATITNEIKLQQVLLTRTFEFEAAAAAEPNANVQVIAGNVAFDFEETEPGVYVSMEAFAAKPNIAYILHVETQDGRTYRSEDAMLTSVAQIEIKAERITNDVPTDGIAILVDSFDPTGSAINYRYTYEESYRIIAPEWRAVDLVADEAQAPCGVKKINKLIDDRVCYATVLSDKVIQINTSDLDADRVSNLMVRFIDRNNFIISHRYTILVKQFVQSNIAFRFYKTLGEFSSSESLFSQTQPGFLVGNVFSEQDETEKVLGFFEVASVTEQRIFFNYTDFYPNEPLPPFVDPCTAFAPPLTRGLSCNLLPAIEERNEVRFFQDNLFPQMGEGPFFVVPRACGDCTALGEIEIPEFWIE